MSRAILLLMKTIALCSSANFYRQLVDIQAKLEKLGYRVVIPATAEAMKKSGDYDVSHVKTWFSDDKDYHKKSLLMKSHFKEIESVDSILVLNYEKNGLPNYIGGNVLMEMAIAFYLNKSIFIFNEIPKESTFLEEIKAVGPIVLQGKLEQLSKY
jgi:hypothetical protein